MKGIPCIAVRRPRVEVEWQFPLRWQEVFFEWPLMPSGGREVLMKMRLSSPLEALLYFEIMPGQPRFSPNVESAA